MIILLSVNSIAVMTTHDSGISRVNLNCNAAWMQNADKWEENSTGSACKINGEEAKETVSVPALVLTSTHRSKNMPIVFFVWGLKSLSTQFLYNGKVLTVCVIEAKYI